MPCRGALTKALSRPPSPCNTPRVGTNPFEMTESGGDGMSGNTASVDVSENFPGFTKYPGYLSSFCRGRQIKAALDLGGGANPMLSRELLDRYDLLDINSNELAKAAPNYHDAHCVDACAASLPGELVDRYDLVFSHMFLEHIKEPELLHRNVATMLKPRGYALHLYPCNSNLPLFLNTVVPESVSSQLVAFFQPERDLSGNEAKFPAYYARCGPPSSSLRSWFYDLGYETIEHSSYVGHTYYDRVPILRTLEKRLRPVIARARLPLRTFNLLLLQKIDQTLLRLNE